MFGARASCCAVALALFVVGCGSSGGGTGADMGSEEGRKVALLIEDMNDAKGNQKRTVEMFVKGTKPPDPKKLVPYDYAVLGKPAIAGETATCKVRIDKPTGEKVGEVEWTFEKEGDKWKIKSAPLP
ncbi:Signal peptide-domain containing protein OS=Planctomyces brasiliensis (strain ATCC 49424 / DSM 5305 / JCM 21570 / NBRC 103401 / IFAM 1448) GN=Plabr_3097 PE=4 SV=1 [Gemmata massiliana]|uniref:Signal peptide-domain containing protein n=1 Tax=Gemmata massiliana TaxID=1210884 RepID=A0A6P2CYC4_9BACT|nr:hypothetical protein [Gemmata massiliana]VTR94001.1 Signal peptide-domain containing protein OS=Planctomyces brasiliensis (strain ATCC 49424 / DSM 5305 / JCM 21570 / NBRC 103401 / IFAM 1448) GN=Plabr_3097 PE=4 SV=1 [Gemmata massiliana]